MLPTLSPALLPTRLLAVDTTPVIPVTLAQVMAPALETEPPNCQLGLRMASLVEPRKAKEFEPTKSPAVAPTKLLLELTTPVTPVAWSIQVTAPLFPPQFGLNSKDLLLPRLFRSELPTRSPAVPPTRLLLLEINPVTGAALSNQVAEPALLFHVSTNST